MNWKWRRMREAMKSQIVSRHITLLRVGGRYAQIAVSGVA